MTDRVNGFRVILGKDIRVDDAEHLKNAILMLKGVLSVQDVINMPADDVAYYKARFDLRNKLFDVLKD